MVFKDLIRTSDLQVPEQALLLYDCWCFFFFCIIVSVRHATWGLPLMLSLTEKWKNLFCMLPIICKYTFIKIIIYFIIINESYMHTSALCNCHRTGMVDNVSHYNISLMFFILYSFSVSEFISDIFHALCINSTLTSLKLGENVLGEHFQVCVVKPLLNHQKRTVPCIPMQCLALFSLVSTASSSFNNNCIVA